MNRSSSSTFSSSVLTSKRGKEREGSIIPHYTWRVGPPDGKSDMKVGSMLASTIGRDRKIGCGVEQK